MPSRKITPRSIYTAVNTDGDIRRRRRRHGPIRPRLSARRSLSKFLRNGGTASNRNNALQNKRPSDALMAKVRKAQDLVESGETPVTRRTRQLTGAKLEGQKGTLKWDDCLLCTKGYYTEKELREHYTNVHSLRFGQASLPNSKIAIENFIKDTNRIQPESTRCSICLLEFEDSDDLVLHKIDKHVKKNFRGYGCDVCGKRFVLKMLWMDHKAEECLGGDEANIM